MLTTLTGLSTVLEGLNTVMELGASKYWGFGIQ